MATDYAEKEREFIGGLEADTGRPLDAWMQAISQSGATGRNDIIDWLRQMGFTFANASWLERIHHNGGRLVYADDVPMPLSPAPPKPSQHKVASQRLSPAAKLTPAIENAAARDSTPLMEPSMLKDLPASEGQAATSAAFDAEVLDLLAAAKGLRPLAVLALQQISASLPQTTFKADGPLMMLSAPKPFLALLPGAKTLRFYGDFGGTAHERLARAEALMKVASKAAPPFPAVLVLSDARLADETFSSLILAAHARAHS